MDKSMMLGFACVVFVGSTMACSSSGSEPEGEANGAANTNSKGIRTEYMCRTAKIDAKDGGGYQTTLTGDAIAFTLYIVAGADAASQYQNGVYVSGGAMPSALAESATMVSLNQGTLSDGKVPYSAPAYDFFFEEGGGKKFERIWVTSATITNQLFSCPEGSATAIL